MPIVPQSRTKTSSEMVQFSQHEQNSALSTFLPILHPHLPHSNPLYNRLRAPHNLPSRHCVFAATFPPNTSPIPESYTILFADRSRHSESQIWIFNPLIALPGALSPSQQNTLNSHVQASILFLKNLHLPQAPGWPFQPYLKYAALHEKLAAPLLAVGGARDAVPRMTRWNLWVTKTIVVPQRALPEGFSIGRVPANQIDIVISTSSIPRQPSTYLLLPSVGVLNAEGILVAWGYIGIDGSFATLYVQPEYRGKGLAKTVAVELLARSEAGDFADMGFDGSSGWVHSDVYDGNEASEAVMKSIGGEITCESFYIWIDSDKF